MTRELKNSEYSYKTAREIIIGGIRGWKTRLKLREKKHQAIYRPAHKTVRTRERKKLLSRENWYKNEEQNQEQENRTGEQDHHGKDRTLRCSWPPRGSPSPGNPTCGEQKNNQKPENNPKAVMFVPYTHGSVLIKKLRENEEKIAKFTKHKIKLVERAGIKLQDVLTKSNPWKGEDCQRTNCLLCHTKNKTEKNKTQDCYKRNLVYETRCLTCKQVEHKKIENMDFTEQENY